MALIYPPAKTYGGRGGRGVPGRRRGVVRRGRPGPAQVGGATGGGQAFWVENLSANARLERDQWLADEARDMLKVVQARALDFAKDSDPVAENYGEEDIERALYGLMDLSLPQYKEELERLVRQKGGWPLIGGRSLVRRAVAARAQGQQFPIRPAPTQSFQPTPAYESIRAGRRQAPAPGIGGARRAEGAAIAPEQVPARIYQKNRNILRSLFRYWTRGVSPW